MAAATDHCNAVRRGRANGSRIGTGFAAAAAIFILFAGVASAQAPADPQKPAEAQQPAADDAPAPAPPAATAPPAEPAGVVGAFGTLMQQGVTSMTTGFDAMVGAAKGAADAASTVAKGAADAAKGAAGVAVDGVTKLPVAGIAAGREQCAIAGNGAPDCQVAAAALCRAQGFSTGTSVDFETAENCPAGYRASSREQPEGACPLEHFVTRALCK